MNRYSNMAMRVAGDLEDAIAAYSNMENLKNRYSYMKVESKNVKEVLNLLEGDKIVIECVLYFEQLVFSGQWLSFKLTNKIGEAVATQAFLYSLDKVQDKMFKKIADRLESEPPMQDLVGYREADDYEVIDSKVQSISFGKTFYGNGSVGVDGRVKMVIQAKKLDISEGIYDKMDTAQLKRLVQEYANNAPEDFWMDGEYRGPANARVTQIMQKWRAMTPNQQQKHYNESRRWK